MFSYAIYRMAPPLLPLRPVPPETAEFLWIVFVVVAVVLGLCLLLMQKTNLHKKQSRWISRAPS
jgi:hypothetical protein